MCDLKGRHNGILKMNDPKKRENCLKTLNFGPILKFKKLAYAELSGKTNHMCKINVGLLATAQL